MILAPVSWMVTRGQCPSSDGILCPSSGSQVSVLRAPPCPGSAPSPGCKHSHHHHHHQSRGTSQWRGSCSLVQTLVPTATLHQYVPKRAPFFSQKLPHPPLVPLWEVLSLLSDPGGFSDSPFFHIPCLLSQKISWGLPQNMSESDHSSSPPWPPHSPLPMELEQ